MDSILVVNLKRFGDIFSCSNIVASIKESYPDSKIDILVFNEFSKAANCLLNINDVHTINRKDIITLSKNELFSNAFALEKFYDLVSSLKNNNYTDIINYSNDKVSTYITSFLTYEEKKFHGIRFRKNHNIEFSNEWATIFNEVLTQFKHTPLNFIDNYAKIAKIKISNELGRIKSNSKYNQKAYENFNLIRKSEAKNNIQLKLVGVQLKTSTKSKDIKLNTLVETISLILDDPELFPILLFAPSEDERSYANEINKEFNNELVTVEADFNAIPSVLLNIDILLTPDTVIKHIADLVETPSVEVSLGNSPFLKQGSTNKNSVIITADLNSRQKSDSYLNTPVIESNDIYNAIKCALNPNRDNLTTFSENISLYRPRLDELGSYYLLTGGSLLPACEISRHIAREFIKQKFNVTKEITQKSIFKNINNSDISMWLKQEKDATTSITKCLLSTLRTLLKINNKNNEKNDFIYALDELLQYGNSDYIGAIPVLLFKAKLENCNSKNQKESTTQIETFLFSLKNDIQLILNIFKEVENHILKDVNKKLKQSSHSNIISNTNYSVEV